MGKIEWSMWANEHALASCLIMIIGGILAVVGMYNIWGMGVYAIVVGVIVFVIEYPRGKPKSGTALERKFQRPFAFVISKGRLLTRNYYSRFGLYLAISVPCYFVLQTVLGAMCLTMTSFIYFGAAYKGEEWLPVEPPEDQAGPKVIAEPQRPPPRRPDNVQLPQRQSQNQL